MAAPIKMDELLVSWLGSDEVYDNVMTLIEKYRVQRSQTTSTSSSNNATGVTPPGSPKHGGGEEKEEMMMDSESSLTMGGLGGGGGNNKNNAANAKDGNNRSGSGKNGNGKDLGDSKKSSGTTGVNNNPAVIPPFFPLKTSTGTTVRRRRLPRQSESWEPLPEGTSNDDDNGGIGGRKVVSSSTATSTATPTGAFGENLNSAMQNGIPSNQDESGEGGGGVLQEQQQEEEEEVVKICVRDQLTNLLRDLQLLPPLPPGSSSSMNVSDPPPAAAVTISPEAFLRICKEIFQFPTFFHGPLYQRILDLYNNNNSSTTTGQQQQQPLQMLNMEVIEWYWKLEMEPYDPSERFFRLVKQPDNDCILRDDFLPFIKALLNDHPGLEFLSNHAEFQEKYAVTVITRIFYSVNKCHSGRITSRQVRRSDLVESFNLVDDEEDINKVTRYFSYEHFYVLYCRFWELDHDRDYRITREDLLKYGDHALSHMIVDRIFDAAPRPFEEEKVDREFLSYEDFIYFMLSEEDKSNDVSVRYWFTCVDVDGDSKLNNMEMRSFYAVQLHRMQCMGHEIVPFEDMLCQMMDMIKPKNSDHLIVEDFLQEECSQVSGALFDALFNLNKYLMFEQRDPFVERQKREDEFDTDWDRFACIDYNRLAMEEEAREEEAMEIDWVTVDEDEEGSEEEFGGAISSETAESPF